MLEWQLIAEKERLVGGHGFDHSGHKPTVPRQPQRDDELAEVGEAGFAGHRQQPAFDQILLVGGQVEAGAFLQKTAQKIIVQWRHERSPANTRTSFGAI